MSQRKLKKRNRISQQRELVVLGIPCDDELVISKSELAPRFYLTPLLPTTRHHIARPLHSVVPLHRDEVCLHLLHKSSSGR